MCSIIGRPSSGTIGFGVSPVMLLSRVPMPPAMITAFIMMPPSPDFCFTLIICERTQIICCKRGTDLI